MGTLDHRSETRARARQNHIAHSQAFVDAMRNRRQGRLKQEYQATVAQHSAGESEPAEPVIEKTERELPRNAPFIALSLREHMNIHKQSESDKQETEFHPEFEPLMGLPEMMAFGGEDASTLLNHLLPRIRLAIIKRIQNGEWDEFLGKVIQDIVNMSMEEA